MYLSLDVNYRLFLSDFKETWIITTYFRKILIYWILWKFAQWELSCALTDRQTDRHITLLIVAFGNFANAPKDTKCDVLISSWCVLLSIVVFTRHGRPPPKKNAIPLFARSNGMEGKHKLLPWRLPGCARSSFCYKQAGGKVERREMRKVRWWKVKCVKCEFRVRNI